MENWITFDLDGTLMQNPFGQWVFPEIEERLSLAAKRPVRLAETLMREHSRRLAGPSPAVAAYDWDGMVQELADSLQAEVSLNIEQLVRKHSAEPKISLLEPGIIAVLETLKLNGYSLAAVTNGFYKYQFPVMEKLGLSGFMTEVVTPERAGCCKPDAAILRNLLERGTVAAHVGDRLDHDVALARAAGVPAVWICRDLPEQLHALLPEKRTQRAEFTELLKRHWDREQGDSGEQFDGQHHTPSHILLHLGELPGCMERLSR